MSAKPSKNAGGTFKFTDWLDLWTTWAAAVLLCHRTAWKAEGDYTPWKVKDRCDICQHKGRLFPGWTHINSIEHVASVCGVSPVGLRAVLGFCTQLTQYRDHRVSGAKWSGRAPLAESWIALAKHHGFPAKVNYSSDFQNRVAGIQAAFTRHHRESVIDEMLADDTLFVELGFIEIDDLQALLAKRPRPSKEEVQRFSGWVMENRGWLFKWGRPVFEGANGKPTPWLPQEIADDLYLAHLASECVDQPKAFRNEFKKFLSEAFEEDEMPGQFEAWRKRADDLLTDETRLMVERAGWDFEILAAHIQIRNAFKEDDPKTLERLALSGLEDDAITLEEAVWEKAVKCMRLMLAHRPFGAIPWKIFSNCHEEFAEGLMLLTKELFAKHGERVWHWIDEAVSKRGSGEEAVRSAVERVKLEVSIGAGSDAPAKRPPRRERQGPSGGI